MHKTKPAQHKRRRSRWRETSLMHFLLNRAVNPALKLHECLANWNEVAASLREPPRKRHYQMDCAFG